MLREDLDRIDSVPMLPELVARILKMMDDPQVSAYQLAKVVAKDQSLVSAILRVVNSAYYGLLCRVASVSQAVVLLGFRTIRNLVLTATVMNAYGGRSSSGIFDRSAHWRHSIGCAAAATVLAKQWRKSEPEGAFLAGLVHDIGRVIMDQYFPDEFEKALALADWDAIPLTQAEERVFDGFTHADIGRHVAQKWKFPDDIVSGIGGHHGPGEQGSWGNLAAVVHIADVMAHRAGLAVGTWQPELDEAALEAIGRSEEQVEELNEMFLEEYKRSDIFRGLIV